MTHTLHREGSYDSLKNDFIVLQMPGQKRTMKGSAENNRTFIRLAVKNNAVNYNHETIGARYTIENALARLTSELADGGGVHAVFRTPADLTSFLCDLKEADMGYSVVVSGLMSEVGKCCHDAGLKRHTVNLSLGIHGKTEKLLPDDVREVTTMCGHGMVTGGLVMQAVESIAKKGMPPRLAAERLATLCPCGVFNPVRAEELLLKMAEAYRAAQANA